MIGYVITIKGHEKSEKYAERCIESGAKNNITIEKFYGYTPADNPREVMAKKGINSEYFDEKYSKSAAAMACFLSHHALWEKCKETKQELAVFEHDAVVVNQFPNIMMYDKLITFSKPSYGKFETPQVLGVGPLSQKRYFGGAHGYALKPAGSVLLLKAAKRRAGPADVFLHLDQFSFLQEYYPWLCEARDSFTTIQRREGCLAKHNYSKDYEVAYD